MHVRCSLVVELLPQLQHHTVPTLNSCNTVNNQTTTALKQTRGSHTQKAAGAGRLTVEQTELCDLQTEAEEGVGVSQDNGRLPGPTGGVLMPNDPKKLPPFSFPFSPLPTATTTLFRRFLLSSQRMNGRPQHPPDSLRNTLKKTLRPAVELPPSMRISFFPARFKRSTIGRERNTNSSFPPPFENGPTRGDVARLSTTIETR